MALGLFRRIEQPRQPIAAIGICLGPLAFCEQIRHVGLCIIFIGHHRRELRNCISAGLGEVRLDDARRGFCTASPAVPILTFSVEVVEVECCSRLISAGTARGIVHVLFASGLCRALRITAVPIIE